MSTDYQTISQDAKRQSDLSAWRKNWSPVIARLTTSVEGRTSAFDVTPAQAADAARTVSFSMPIFLVRSMETSTGSTNRVAAAAAYAEMGE